MKLTNIDRDAFVRAVMHDVPCVDYKAQAAAAVRDYVQGLMPQNVDVMNFYHEHPEFFNLATVYTECGNIAVRGPDTLSDTSRTVHAELHAQITAIETQHGEQRDMLDALEDKVRAVIYGCTTLKQAEERLPEFKAYLPKERNGATSGVPAVANLVADLVAHGWPRQRD